MKKFLLSWFVASMVLGFTGESVAATLYVDVNAANPVTPFTSWATAATNIQSAVDAAVDGDTVSVTNGHYLLSSEILVTNNITIQSVNGSGSTVVDGGGVTRCFNLTDRDCLISGLTITNGHSADDGGGGGIYCSGISPVVSNCIITGNIAAGTYSIGGGMVQGTANNCTISGNSAKYGGGMCGYPSGCIANNCMISGNSAIAGGGVHSGTLNNCIITGNSAQDGDGGGMAYGTANNCTISGNASIARGGGTYVTTATNCIVWYNEGSGEQKNMLN
ncbi:MAG: hypothetical protein DRH04_06425 [Deltaproteobacteria bacterium]|nr:MAG: hypothetical protein DRH04_06425 [Deltaproteobacteria bacterium]